MLKEQSGAAFGGSCKYLICIKLNTPPTAHRHTAGTPPPLSHGISAARLLGKKGFLKIQKIALGFHGFSSSWGSIKQPKNSFPSLRGRNCSFHTDSFMEQQEMGFKSQKDAAALDSRALCAGKSTQWGTRDVNDWSTPHFRLNTSTALRVSWKTIKAGRRGDFHFFKICQSFLNSLCVMVEKCKNRMIRNTSEVICRHRFLHSFSGKWLKELNQTVFDESPLNELWPEPEPERTGFISPKLKTHHIVF